DRQYDTLDKDHILCVKKEGFGYSALTNERQYYQENYPSLIVERCGIDQVETMLIGGKENESDAAKRFLYAERGKNINCADAVC
ncbi:hypothetical protein LH384_34125, partial [Pseudomonas aeruginosa]|nr:hypothetical protein [Pseudomonas aeruginosa]